MYGPRKNTPSVYGLILFFELNCMTLKQNLLPMRGGGAAARLVECTRPGLVRRGQPDVAPGGPSCGHPGLPAARRSSPAQTAPPAARVVRFSVMELTTGPLTVGASGD
jgi:hypothetical protein